jgi:hypothetical protein
VCFETILVSAMSDSTNTPEDRWDRLSAALSDLDSMVVSMPLPF